MTQKRFLATVFFLLIGCSVTLPQTTITKSVTQGAGGSSEWVFNETKIGGTTIDVNSGNKSNGTQRVVLATDQPSLTNPIPVSQSGSWTMSISGTPTVSISGTSTIAGTKTNNNAAPGATNIGTLPAIANAAAPSWTEGNQVGLSTDLAGALRVTGSLSVGGTTDNSAFTAGTSTGTPAMGFYHSTIDTVTDGRAATLAIDSKRNLFEVIRDAAGNARGANVNSSNQLSVSVDNTPTVTANAGSGTFNIQQSNVTADYDTGAGTQNLTIFGIALPASGGAVAGGTSSNPIQVSLANTAANSTAVKVDNSAVTQPVSGTITANAGTNLNTSALALESGGNLATLASAVHAEDAASADADKGITLLATRKATPANTSGTDGDYETLQVNAGRLWASSDLTLAGTAVSANSGNKDAGTVRVVLATDQPQPTNKFLVTPDANSSINVNQIAGNTALTGNGTTGTGSQRVTIASDNTAFSVNPLSATAPIMSMNSASANSGVNSAIAGVFDDTSPTTITENNFGFLRMSSNRNLYGTIRDAAGNERGANVNASNQLSVSVDNTAAQNQTQIGGTTIDVNSGNKSNGTQRFVLATDQPTMTNAQPVTPQATESFLGFVGGKATIVSANFTRPPDTTAYASGDLIANSTTAGSVTPMSFTASRINDASGMVRRATLKKSTTGTTNASFRLHLYQNDPSASSGITNGDNGAWSTKIANYLGSLTCDMTAGTGRAFSDAAAAQCSVDNGSEINFIPKSGTQTIYGLLEARGAYTPGNAEVFTVYLEILQN